MFLFTIQEYSPRHNGGCTVYLWRRRPNVSWVEVDSTRRPQRKAKAKGDSSRICRLFHVLTFLSSANTRTLSYLLIYLFNTTNVSTRRFGQFIFIFLLQWMSFMFGIPFLSLGGKMSLDTPASAPLNNWLSILCVSLDFSREMALFLNA